MDTRKKLFWKSIRVRHIGNSVSIGDGIAVESPQWMDVYAAIGPIARHLYEIKPANRYIVAFSVRETGEIAVRFAMEEVE